jgi:flagellar hook assembly protein FlgD
MRVFDASGRLVRTLVDRQQSAGYHVALWDGTSDSGDPLASGIYFCRMDAAGTTLTQKMLLLK